MEFVYIEFLSLGSWEYFYGIRCIVSYLGLESFYFDMIAVGKFN